MFSELQIPFLPQLSAPKDTLIFCKFPFCSCYSAISRLSHSIAQKSPKNKGFSSILSLIFRVFLLCVIKARSISLKISPQPCDVGALFQSLNALPHHIVQFHTEHLAALADHVTVYAGGKGFGLKFLFERFQLQIQHAL